MAVVVFGLPCKPGWGFIFQEPVQRFVPVNAAFVETVEEEIPPRHTIENRKPIDLKNTSLPLSYLNFPSSEKYLNFCIGCGNQFYYEFNWFIITKIEKRMGQLYDPKDCTHIVTEVQHGVDLVVRIPLFEYPGGMDKFEIDLNSMDTKKFSPNLLQMKCRVLINYDEIRELNLEELINLAYQIYKKKIQKYQAPVWAIVTPFKNNLPNMQVVNEKEFQSFLCCIYCAFKKIELKLTKRGRPTISSESVGSLDLISAKEQYCSIDRTDMANMYQKLKRLYFSYLSYLADRIAKKAPIEEGELISGEFVELQELLERIDEWNPVEKDVSNDASLEGDENKKDSDHQIREADSFKIPLEVDCTSSFEPDVVYSKARVVVRSHHKEKFNDNSDVEEIENFKDASSVALVPPQKKHINLDKNEIKSVLQSSNQIPKLQRPTESEKSCKKVLDFEIVFDDQKYWEVKLYICRQKKALVNFQRYPLSCSHFVRGINYGVDLRVQFPKTGFPEEIMKMKDLFEKRNLNESQKKTKCRVLINYTEVKHMTLEELVNFMRELDERKYSQYDIPVRFECEKFIQRIRETIVHNENGFGQFLTNLYCVYRKIEMRMEKAGYPDILPNIYSEEKSFVKICINLHKAKIYYKSMEKNNFLKMYSILKRLFLCYTDYIKYSVENTSNMDEGSYIPGSIGEMTLWLEKLNTWLPKKVNGEWVNSVSLFIGAPLGYEQLIKMLRETTKFKYCQVIKDDRAVEPYIGDENDKKVLFGFINMEGAEVDHTVVYSTAFESECPEECTQDLRRWICTKCGDFVRTKLNPTGQQFLFCSCGLKKYKERLLFCNHSKHRPQKLEPNQQTTQPTFKETDSVNVSAQGNTKSTENGNKTISSRNQTTASRIPPRRSSRRLRPLPDDEPPTKKST